MNKNSSHLLPYYYLTCWVYLFSFLTEKYCWRYVSHLRAVNCNMNNNGLVHAATMLLLHLHMTDLPFLLCAGGSDMCIIFLPILTSPAIRFCGKGCWYRNKWINCCCNSWRRYEWCPTWLKSLANGYSFWLPVLKLVVCVCSVSEVELQRAKNSTISSVLMNLESRVIMNPWSVSCFLSGIS